MFIREKQYSMSRLFGYYGEVDNGGLYGKYLYFLFHNEIKTINVWHDGEISQFKEIDPI